MMVSFLKTKNRATESTSGLIIAGIKGGGSMANNMAWACIKTTTKRLCVLGCGREVNAWFTSTKTK